MVWGRALLAGTVIAGIALGCPSKDSGGPATRAVTSGTRAAGGDGGSPRGTTLSAPGGPVCPADHPTLCSNHCCLAGSGCADGGTPGIDAGTCLASSAPPACPAGLPVACTAAPVATADGGLVSFDLSPQANDAILFAPMTFGEGRGSSALDLPVRKPSDPCTNAAATAPGVGMPIGDQAHAIEAWVRLDGTGPVVQGIVDLGSGGTARTDGIGFTSSDLFIYTGPGYAELLFNDCSNGSPNLTPNTWHLVAGSYDGKGGLTTLFVDGVSSQRGCPGIGYNQPASSAVTFGNGTSVLGTTCAPFAGQIDEVRILSSALSPSEAAADFAAAHLPLTANTVGLWTFNEGAPIRCCAAGSTCDPSGGCSASPETGSPSCPPGSPSCGGFCCPAGASCSNGACVESGTVPVNVCGANQVAVPETFTNANTYDCCPFPGSVPVAQATTCFGTLAVTCALPSSVSASPTCNQGACPIGYSCCQLGANSYGCVAPTASGGQCTSGPACAGKSRIDAAGNYAPGGCCGSGTVCGAPDLCCPAGDEQCGTGCCPAGKCVNGSCGAVSSCPSGGVACGTICCAAGEFCARPGVCTQPPAATASCISGACNSVGPCCPSGSACTSDGTCVSTAPVIPATVPLGPPCASGRCAAAQLCSGAGCCPSDHPDGCGSSCCLSGGCSNNTCSCPASLPVACGSDCCEAGSACSDGHCVPQCPGGAAACGDSCCEAGIACLNGKCVCPGDHPVVCGDFCCLGGAVCGASGCGCPAGQVSCRNECCGVGETCQSGVCAAASSSGCDDGSGQPRTLQSCPGGAQMCCYNPEVCCVSAFDGKVGCFPRAYCR